MNRILLCWLGRTDLRAVTEADQVGTGPIAQALGTGRFARLELLCDYPAEAAAPYLDWLRARTDADIIQHLVTLPGPTDFDAIYRHARALAQQVTAGQGVDAGRLTFHLSPGTPAMAAVWIILAKTRFPAELIESSRDHGVRTVSVPFQISADFIPDLLRRPDAELTRLTAGLPPAAPAFDAIIHQSPVMQRVVARARRVALRTIPVLIEGESGTGKELLARAIHQASPRRERPMLTVNCGAIPAELIESELFGHEKGAFTGAVSARPGVFEAADTGTLFLDEVGELPKPAQVRFLRALQEGEITRASWSLSRFARDDDGNDNDKYRIRRRHQPQPDRGGRRRPLPRGPVLSPRRRRPHLAAAARARRRRRPAAGAPARPSQRRQVNAESASSMRTTPATPCCRAPPPRPLQTRSLPKTSAKALISMASSTASRATT